ncbi:hypothetical protein WN55_03325 [Dufourea novaeangliae]|uniref:Uncharacterized protein n=1 Tax=Dufourea novaeangliae TaxID=178035 RepID=A0A154PL44_DUFNO|nr:hypothetical protein WN55_03325 [Dufourea novaeangliae]
MMLSGAELLEHCVSGTICYGEGSYGSNAVIWYKRSVEGIFDTRTMILGKVL